jgi:D-sedoheptulose 7-phosphate isomerase
MNNIIIKRIIESKSVKEEILKDTDLLNLVENIAQEIVSCIRSGNKVMFAGNGGSFSDSFHLAGEFVSRFLFDREPLPAIALGGNNSIITAIGNDYSFMDIFSREIKALGNKGDIFIAISTSGNSGNILNAIEVAKGMGIKTYGFTGNRESKINTLCQCVRVPSEVTARIQEAHILIGHIICELVENEIFNRN